MKSHAPTSAEREREAFERNIVERATSHKYQHLDTVLKRSDEGYATTWVDSAWLGWQARAAMQTAELVALCLAQDENAAPDHAPSIAPDDTAIPRQSAEAANILTGEAADEWHAKAGVILSQVRDTPAPADSAAGWISVEDRLPGYSVPVLATLRDVIGIGFRYERSNGADAYSFNGTSSSGDRFKFTHWQPLPAPPAIAALQPEGGDRG